MRTELEQVYRTHRQTLLSLALSITGCVAGAEDSVHDAFARILKREREVPTDPVSYVFAAVRNAAIDDRRLRHRERIALSSLLSEPSATSVHPMSELMDLEEREMLLRAIEDLDDESQQIVIMKIYSDLTFEQIASIVDSPLGSVATRYRRALLKIESQLRSHHDRSKSATV